MAGVEKLIEVAVTEIGQGGGYPHIVFDDAILPLHGFETGAHGETIDVLVLSAGGARLAYATAGSIDTSDLDLASVTNETGCQLALLQGQPVELLDLAILAGAAAGPRPTCRLPTGDSWSREVLRPLVESAGYQVLDDPELQVDLEILLEGEKALPPGNAAGETLLIGNNGKGRKPGVAAIDRDDRAALMAAVHAANRRRA